MINRVSRPVRILAIFVLVVGVGSCGLPRSGPNKAEIFAGSVQREGDAFVITVNDRVIQATAVAPIIGFDEKFQRAGRIGADTIRPGDVLNITVYENVDNALLAGVGGTAAVLPEVQVDAAGQIFIPYAGQIKAAGLTPEQLRAEITTKLDAQTPDPQVTVRRVPGDGASISVMGGVGGQGVYPITGATLTLTSMLAKAGGVLVEPEVAQVKVTRGDQTGVVWLQDLYSNSRFDIALRPGDRIFVEEDTRAFTALGATGAQTRISFQSQTMNVIEAIAQVGGLNSTLADPTGVFVFRDEPAAIANSVLGRNDLTGFQRFIYVLNLTEPNGMFRARDFIIRDGDTVYVTEAPYVQWNKSLTLINGTISSTSSAVSAAKGN